jgi:hypothetical protein
VNSILLKNRPKDADPKEFQKVWDNSGYALTALYSTLEEFKTALNTVKADDFDCPNHYAKLAFQAGMAKAYETVMSLLPESAKK